MQDYSKLRLIMARTRAEVVRDQYIKDKFLHGIMRRIIEDIGASILFDELEVDSEVPKKISIQG